MIQRMTRTAKEIALELLEKYRSAESMVIAEYSVGNEDRAELETEVENYRKEIEQAE